MLGMTWTELHDSSFFIGICLVTHMYIPYTIIICSLLLYPEYTVTGGEGDDKIEDVVTTSKPIVNEESKAVCVGPRICYGQLFNGK